MKNAIRLMIATLFLAVSAFAGVTVSSPTSGSTIGSPVHFVASASSSAPITAMRIYVDSVSVYTGSAGNLDTYVSMANGTHNVTVQAWDATGAVFVNPETITVSGTASGVAVTSPADNATVNSPMQVNASAISANPIAAMAIYLDGARVYLVNGNSLNTQVTAGAGPHSLVVQAWDMTGAVYGKTLSVTISSSTPTGPPANATVKSGIQAMPGWGSCNTCAGINANGPVASYSLVQNQTSPSLTGKSAKFSIWGTNPYSDVIWWEELGAADAASHFQYDADFYLTTPQYAFALEFDANQTVNSRRFVFGTQCGVNYDNQWDVWDTAGGHWIKTGVPCSIPAAYQWHHLTWEYYRDSTSIHYVAVTVDGVKHYVNMAFSSKAWSNSPELNVAFQMDADSSMHTYSTWLDNLTLTYW